MKKIIYTRPDGGLSIVIPLPKEKIEEFMGPLTVEEYENHVLSRSIPSDAINVRHVDDSDIPADREFRNAWRDVTAASSLDIDVEKVKELQLAKLRADRQVAFEALGFPTKLNPEIEALLSQGLRDELQALRDVTNPLKAVDAVGKYNDNALISEIKAKGKL